jgi:hypothetical protein
LGPIIPLLLVLAFAGRASGQERLLDGPISRIEHFFAISGDPETLLSFLKTELMLPEAWPYRDYGDFASGGISLGNVVFEAVRFPGTVRDGARFAGIALEPEVDTRALVPWLESHGVEYADPEPFPPGADEPLWENTLLPELSTDGWTIFVCDYKYRSEVAAGRAAAATELAVNGGGPLRISGVEALVLTSPDVGRAFDTWSRVLHTRRHGDSLNVELDDGPLIRIRSGQDASQTTLVLSTESLDSAAGFLESRGWLGARDPGSVTLAPYVIQGLHIVLVQTDRGVP